MKFIQNLKYNKSLSNIFLYHKSGADIVARADNSILSLIAIYIYGIFSLYLVTYAPYALASAKFDINAGVVAATTPLVSALQAHWGKGVLLSGGASALIGEGDLRQRAIRAAIGCTASGGVVLALLAMLA